MRTIYAEYNINHDSIDVYTSAGYMLRINCWEAEKNLKTHMDQNVRLLHWLWMSLWNMQDYILMAIYRCGWMQKIHLNYRQFKQKFISDFRLSI